MAFLVVSGASGQSVINDKLEGMLILGAFGDALGAKNENVGLSDHISPDVTCLLSPAGSFYNTTQQEQNCWGIWPPTSLVSETYGVVTDDTCFKMALLEPYLRTCVVARKLPDQVSFKEWLLVNSTVLYHDNLQYQTDWYFTMSRIMAADWVVMDDAGQVGPPPPKGRRMHGEDAFYVVGDPVVMGMYLYLESAASFYHYPPYLVYQLFRQSCGLDQLYGSEVTGIFAALLVDALNQNSSDWDSFGTWWFSRTETFLPTWIDLSPPHSSERSNLQRIYNYYGLLKENGEALVGSSPLTFLQSYYKVVNDPIISPHHGMKLQDPLTMFGLITSALAFTQPNLIDSFAIITSSPADTDTCACFLGMVSGAFYGRSNLDQMSCGAISMSKQLNQVETTLETIFQYDVDSTVQLLLQLSHVVSSSSLPLLGRLSS